MLILIQQLLYPPVILSRNSTIKSSWDSSWISVEDPSGIYSGIPLEILAVIHREFLLRFFQEFLWDFVHEFFRIPADISLGFFSGIPHVTPPENFLSILCGTSAGVPLEMLAGIPAKLFPWISTGTPPGMYPEISEGKEGVSLGIPTRISVGIALDIRIMGSS